MRLPAKAEKKKEEKPDKAESMPGEEKDADKTAFPNKVTAGPMEELIAKLKELLVQRAENKAGSEDAAREEAKQERPHFDMTL